MGALLGELSALARDLLIRVTAPQGGAALLSGSYELAALDRLARGTSPARLIHMTGQLQAAAAALPLSVNRRTDAELCLMKLCDESLCGDVTALAARIARLEEGGLPAAVPAEPRPVQSSGAKPAPAPDAPPWEDPAPIPAPAKEETPPWEAPPPPGDGDAPPPEPGSIEAPERPAKPAPGSSGGLWETLIERFKDHVLSLIHI